MERTGPCRLCGKIELLTLLDLGKHPIAHRYLQSKSQDEYVHPVILCFCEDCGLIQLTDPIPADLLYSNYVCLSSWKHQPHIPRIIQMIRDFTGIKKTSTILEVGSNDGRFLKALRAQGYEKLAGIEPAHDAKLAAQEDGIETIPSYFNRKSAEEFVSARGKCDLFVSRQMLEHVNDLKEFCRAMHMVLSPGGFVVFEIPDFLTNLDTFDYSLWEEHINYFTMDTLSHLLMLNGIRTMRSERIMFSGDSLVVIGEYTGKKLPASPSGYINLLRDKVVKYRDNWPVFCRKFIGYLKEERKKDRRMAIYGAGARLCSLVNFTGAGPYIDFIADDQPEKQGKYMPGSRLPILPGSALEEQAVDLCLLAVNTECEDSVIAKHPNFVGKGGSFVSVLPPSSRLPEFWRDLR